MRSSSSPSPSSRAPAWRTCRRGTSWPTPPGLALAVVAHNLGRAVGQLAGPDLDRATTATPAPHGFHRSRSARVHRPPTTPATTRSIAPGRCDQHRPRRNDRAPAPQLNTTLIPTTGPGEAGRPAAPARPTHIRRRRRPPNLSTAPPTRSTVDPCARKRRPQATPEFSAPGSTPTTGCSDKSLPGPVDTDPTTLV
jgi:hypothetical protein